MSIDRPYSEACERNKGPILTILRNVFVVPGTILEIGSGTGQHAVFFASHLHHLNWQPSDLPDQLGGIQSWLAEAPPNVLTPLALEVCQSPWPVQQAVGVFSANTAHIIAWREVECMFARVGEVLAPGAAFCLYGPFNYEGRYTSDSNAHFDGVLKARDPQSGIRDIDDLVPMAQRSGLSLVEDHEMPANNRTLVWRRV